MLMGRARPAMQVPRFRAPQQFAVPGDPLLSSVTSSSGCH